MRDPNQFRIVRRGYDTAQVDGFLDEYERWGESALRHIKALEARLSGHDPNPRTAGRDPEEANQLGGKAQADKAEAERVAAEIVESAQARAREISEAAERDQKKAAQSLAEACQKAERLVDDVKVASDALMRSIKDSSHTCFEDLHRQIQSLEEQRRATLVGLSPIWNRSSDPHSAPTPEYSGRSERSSRIFGEPTTPSPGYSDSNGSDG